MTEEGSPPNDDHPAADGPSDEAPQVPESLADTEAELDYVLGSQEPVSETRLDLSNDERDGRDE